MTINYLIRVRASDEREKKNLSQFQSSYGAMMMNELFDMSRHYSGMLVFTASVIENVLFFVAIGVYKEYFSILAQNLSSIGEFLS